MTTTESGTHAIGLWVGGERRTQGSGGTHDHINPATGLVDDTIPLAGAAEVDEAVVIADRAFKSWRNSPPAQRQALLLKLADLVESKAAEFGECGAREIGAPVLIGTDCEVGLGVDVHGPVVIGDRSRLGAGAMLRDCVVLPGAEVPAGALVVGGLYGVAADRPLG